MIDVAGRLAAMRIVATAPNGMVTAELTGRHDLRLTFVDSYYYRTEERELERQLEGLCRLLWAGRAREFAELVASSGGRVVDVDESRDPRDTEYDRCLEEMRVQGASADGRITIAGWAGMRQWEVRISDGTLRVLTEEEFAAAAAQAARAVVTERFAQAQRAARRIYDGVTDED